MIFSNSVYSCRFITVRPHTASWPLFSKKFFVLICLHSGRRPRARDAEGTAQQCTVVHADQLARAAPALYRQRANDENNSQQIVRFSCVVHDNATKLHGGVVSDHKISIASRVAVLPWQPLPTRSPIHPLASICCPPFAHTSPALLRYPEPQDYFKGGNSLQDNIEVRRLYAAEIENLDEWFGKFVAAVATLGDADNTIVRIFLFLFPFHSLFCAHGMAVLFWIQVRLPLDATNFLSQY